MGSSPSINHPQSEQPEQLDLDLEPHLPQRLDGADAIQPIDQVECDQQEQADREWLERRLFGTESK